MEKRYIGEAVDITYDSRRCIHAEECIHHLESVFKKNVRPWINADGAPMQEIMGVIVQCPSGALHAEPKNGIPAEEAPQRNIVSLWKDGPLQFIGNLEIIGANININETRATLCRCGASANKPFCDNSHHDIDFEAIDGEHIAVEVADDPTGNVMITLESNGPYQVTGNIEILNTVGEVIFVGAEATLCRCGHSANKPFCDGTHEVIGFQAD